MGFPKRIPTIVGILLVLALVGGVSVVFERVSRISTVASGSREPKNVEITNLSDNGFTVTWSTESPATGAIIISSEKRKSLTLFDERDSLGKLGKYLTHSISLRSADPDSLYTIKVLSDGKTYQDGNKPFEIRTAPVITDSPGSLEPAFGNVVTSDNQPATGAIIFVELTGSQTLSSLVKPSGSWLIPLNLIRTSDSQNYLPAAGKITENIRVINSEAEEAAAVTDTQSDSPVPTIVIGKNYDFRQKAQVDKQTLAYQKQPSTDEDKGVTSVLGQSTSPPPKAYTISISVPAQGAALPTAFPLIAGTGWPGKTVLITLGITDPTVDTTLVGADGLWRFTPVRPLGIGRQSVTITTVEASGKSVALTHTFEILKSGTQVLGIATPSGTLTPTPGSTTYPTAAPTLEPTPISTLAGEPLPTSGSILPTYILIILGIGLMLGGGLILASNHVVIY